MSSVAMDNVRFIEYSEVLGNYQTVVKKIQYYDGSIRSSDDAKAMEEYLKLLDRIQPALEYEAIHGLGSLIDLGRSQNRYMMSIGLITAEQIKAAERHSARISRSSFTSPETVADRGLAES